MESDYELSKMTFFVRMSDMNILVALCAIGAEKILGNEIKLLGYTLCGNAPGRVLFYGDDNALFRANLVLRECRASGKFHQQRGSFFQVLFQHSGVEYNLLLGGECIELTAKPVKIAVDFGGRLVRSTLEYGMLREMGNPAVPPFLIPCTAFDAESAVTYR